MKLTEYFQIKAKKKTMTILVTRHSKMVEADRVALEVLVVLVVQTFQISLKTFLEILVEEAEEVQEGEVQIIEVLI